MIRLRQCLYFRIPRTNVLVVRSTRITPNIKIQSLKYRLSSTENKPKIEPPVFKNVTPMYNDKREANDKISYTVQKMDWTRSEEEEKFLSLIREANYEAALEVIIYFIYRIIITNYSTFSFVVFFHFMHCFSCKKWSCSYLFLFEKINHISWNFCGREIIYVLIQHLKSYGKDACRETVAVQPQQKNGTTLIHVLK